MDFSILDPTTLGELLQTIKTSTEKFKLCPNRVWEVGSRLEHWELKLPGLLPKSHKGFETALSHQDHRMCTFDFCEFSRRDFTAVPQLHEAKLCEKNPCIRLRGLFSESELVEALESGQRLTAWTLDGMSIVKHPQPFMAISHVWSDGTGNGIWPLREVNICLYQFFRRIAEHFQCEGIWWDTLCIPKDRSARSKALNTMQDNYGFARITLIHDIFLRNLEWTNPETACFAIIMSPWFGRGWTALELAKSRKVKIIFKNLVIKDLDEDILKMVGKDNGAAKAIESLREPIAKVDDLLSILGHRHTSWLKDQSKIAGLLAGIELQPDPSPRNPSGLSPPLHNPYQRDTFERDTYQRILVELGAISHGHLFHKSATMSGGFNWCATSLLQLPQTRGPPSLRVTECGDIVGLWKAVSAEEIAEDRCDWGNSHPLIEAALRLALTQKDRHVLLIEPDAPSMARGILVRPMVGDSTEDPRVIKSEFVGPLYFSRQNWQVSTHQGVPGKDQDLDFTWINMTIGSTETLTDPGNVLDLLKELKNENGVADQTVPTKARNSALNYPRRDGWTVLHHVAWNCDQKALEALVTEHDSLIPEQDMLGQQALHLAAERGNEDLVRCLLRHQADPNMPCHNGRTALHQGAWAGSRGVVKLLLDGQGEAGVQDKYNNTALHIAAERGFEPVVVELLSKGNVEARGWNDLTPLHYAALNGHEKVVELLVQNGADVNARDNKVGWAPLHLAAINGHVAVARLLLAEDAKVDAKDNEVGWTPLHLAAVNGHQGVVALLIDGGANVKTKDNEGWTPLHLAVVKRNEVEVCLRAGNGTDVGAKIYTYGWAGYAEAVDLLVNEIKAKDEKDEKAATKEHETVVEPLIDEIKAKNEKDEYEKLIELLVKNGADMGNEDRRVGWTPRHCVALEGQDAVVKLVLGDGADVKVIDRKVKRPLHWAAEDGHQMVVKLLIDKGADMETIHDGWTPLQLAVTNGHIIAASRLVAKGANIETTHDGLTPLQLAVINGHAAVVRLLLDNGANVNKKDKNNEIPLHLAARRGHKAIVELLLDEETDINAKNRSNQTPLHLAAGGGQKAVVVALLLDKHTTINAKTSKDRTPLHLAAREGHRAIVELLLGMGAIVNAADEVGVMPLHWAALNGHMEIVEKLIDKHANLEAKAVGPEFYYSEGLLSGTPLHLAAEAGHMTTVELLLNRGANVRTEDDKRRTPLHLAAGEGHFVIVKLLLERKANVNAKDDKRGTPLHFAAKGGYEAVTELLLENHAEVEAKDENKETPLHYAAQGGHNGVAKLLLKNHAQVEAESRYKTTPLHLAAQGGHLEVVELLVDHGANIHAEDDQDRTPLHLAVKNGHEAVFTSLNEKGADAYGTPVHFAAESGLKSVVEMLVKNGADPNAIRDSTTPLHLAAENGHEMVVEFLMKSGANVRAQARASYRVNVTSATPLHLAAFGGHREVAELLIKNGAVVNARAVQDSIYSTRHAGATPLHFAAENGHTAVVQLLLENDARINAEDKGGRTPLIWAERKGHRAVIDLLVRNGAMVFEVEDSESAGSLIGRQSPDLD